MAVYLLIAGGATDGRGLQRLVFVSTHFPYTHALDVLSLSKTSSVPALHACPPKTRHFLGLHSFLLLCCCRRDPSDAGWLCLAVLFLQGRWTRRTVCVYITQEHLVFIRLFKNPPQPLRPDWRVACIGANCLPAGHSSTHTYNLIFPHKDNRAVAAGLLCCFPALSHA